MMDEQCDHMYIIDITLRTMMTSSATWNVPRMDDEAGHDPYVTRQDLIYCVKWIVSYSVYRDVQSTVSSHKKFVLQIVRVPASIFIP